MSKYKKILYIILGLISVALGIIGIFAPGIPTTPFLLLALWCFSHSWISAYNKLQNSKLVSKYVNKNGVSCRSKIYSILLMVTMVSFSSYLHWDNRAISLSIIGLGVVGFIFMVKHIKVDKTR